MLSPCTKAALHPGGPLLGQGLSRLPLLSGILGGPSLGHKAGLYLVLGTVPPIGTGGIDVVCRECLGPGVGERPCQMDGASQAGPLVEGIEAQALHEIDPTDLWGVDLGTEPHPFGPLAPHYGADVALVHADNEVLGPLPGGVPLLLLSQHLLDDGLALPDDMGRSHLWWQPIEHGIELSREFLQQVQWAPNASLRGPVGPLPIPLIGEVLALLLAIPVARHAPLPCPVDLSHLPVAPFTALPRQLHVGGTAHCRPMAGRIGQEDVQRAHKVPLKVPDVQ